MGLMPQPSTLELPPIDLGNESIGQRIARLRTEHGFTQIQLAEAMGLTQALVSSYERGRLRLHAEMVARFAITLKTTADELIGLKSKSKPKDRDLSLKLIRRMQRIEKLPVGQQKTLLQTIDTYLKGANR